VLTIESIILFYGIYSIEDYNLLMDRKYETAVYFCGSDLYWLIENKRLADLAWNGNLYFNVGNVNQLSAFEQYGASAKIAPIFADVFDKHQLTPMPEEFNVVAYVGWNKELF
jgi:hypothetical protein